MLTKDHLKECIVHVEDKEDQLVLASSKGSVYLHLFVNDVYLDQTSLVGFLGIIYDRLNIRFQ